MSENSKTGSIDNTGLWEEAWTPTLMEGEEATIAGVVQQAVGSASMCWESVNRAGIFNSEKAAWVAGGAINQIEKIIFRNYRRGAETNAAALAEATRSMEAGIPEQSAEDRRLFLQRRQDQADLIDLILSYRNPASEETRMRQIRLVME